MDRPMLFGKYCLLERISVGGMAEVFRAKPLPAGEHGKMLALKRILPHLAEDDKFITMFVDEAKLTVQLRHPNIVKTYELGNFQDSHYILMEYLAGADVLTLQKRLRQNKRIMSVAQACYIARETARGLDYVHHATDQSGEPLDLIHRDVSPQNIRVTYDGRVKLIDFGIAKGEIQRTKTQAGVLKGKFGYMSPEQARGDEIDYRTDIFTLGICLWEMLTNRRMFNGENEFETLQMVLEGNYTPPSELNEQVPAIVDEIVLSALAPDIDDRYQRARDFAGELDEFLGSIEQPYTQDHMTQWMANAFEEELAEERKKRELYEKIREPGDVNWFNDEVLGDEAEMPADVGPAESEGHEGAGEPMETRGPAAGGEAEGGEEIWDPDFAPDEDDEVDPEEFGSEHTVVAAGGFDPESFRDEEDEIIALAEEDLQELQVDDQVDGSELVSDQVAELEGADDEWQEREAVEEPLEPEAPGPDDPAIGPGLEGATESSSPAAAPRGETAGGGGAGDGSSPSGPTTPAARGDEEGPAEGIGDTTVPGAEAVPGSDGRSTPDDHRALRFAGAGAALIALIGAGYVGWSMVSGGDWGLVGEPTTGTLVIDVAPKLDGGGTILVGGQKRGTESPVAVSGLAAGERHPVEVRHPAFADVRRQVEVSAGEIGEVDVELERDDEASGRLKLVLDGVGEEARVFVDGEAVRDRAKLEHLGVEPGRHLLEVVAEGKKPWMRIVDIEEGEALVERAALEEHASALEVDAGGDQKVKVDGDDQGRVPVRIEGLASDDEHTIALVAPDSEGVDWESAVAFPRLGNERLEIDLDEPPDDYDSAEIGRLAVETGGDWWSIYVDGVATGFTSPVGPDEGIPIEPGEHTVSLRRGGDVHHVEIDVDDGESVSVDQTFDFAWNPASGDSG